MKNHPWYRIAAGSFLLLMFVAASLFTVLTDESLIGGNGGNLSWEVVLQPWYLVHGMYVGMQLWSVLGAWMIFSAYILLSVIESFKNNKTLHSIALVLVGIDGIANYMYFHAVPWIYQILLSLLVFSTIVYAGTLGITLITEALEEIRR